jgi:hypothetical protein
MNNSLTSEKKFPDKNDQKELYNKTKLRFLIIVAIECGSLLDNGRISDRSFEFLLVGFEGGG